MPGQSSLHYTICSTIVVLHMHFNELHLFMCTFLSGSSGAVAADGRVEPGDMLLEVMLPVAIMYTYTRCVLLSLAPNLL